MIEIADATTKRNSPIIRRDPEAPPPKPKPLRLPRAAPAEAAPRPALHVGSCQFPMWGYWPAPTHVYCGAPCVRGSSWCAHHYDRVAA